MTITDEKATIGLCLSGGGFRASLFHVGVLRRLNEIGLLGRINTFSSVSGGSILNGLLALRWRDLRKDASGRFENFESVIEQPMRVFCSKNVRNKVLIADRFSPKNWLKLAKDDYSITNKLVEAYDDEGFLNGATISVLTEVFEGGGPRFILCATNMATGVNWEFDAKGIGDYKLGRTQKPGLKLAFAVAASSAFPLAFPPLKLSLQGSKWAFGDESLEQLEALRDSPELSDGGVYDNMGLEPVWKTHNFVLCSDAGAPFKTNEDPGDDFIRRLIRSNDIIDRQSRALRRRMLIDAIERGDYGGAFWGIGTKIEDYPLTLPASGYSGATLKAIASIRTDLDVFKKEEQLVLMNHGWLLASSALQSRCPDWPQAPGQVPDQDLLDNAVALKALG